jgi:tetracycline repressor-like protein
LVPTLRTPRRAKAALLFQRAMKRGELPADSDLEMCMDFLAGPLYWRLAVVHTPTSEDYLDRLTDRIIAALTVTA